MGRNAFSLFLFAFSLERIISHDNARAPARAPARGIYTPREDQREKNFSRRTEPPLQSIPLQIMENRQRGDTKNTRPARITPPVTGEPRAIRAAPRALSGIRRSPARPADRPARLTQKRQHPPDRARRALILIFLPGGIFTLPTRRKTSGGRRFLRTLARKKERHPEIKSTGGAQL